MLLLVIIAFFILTFVVLPAVLILNRRISHNCTDTLKGIKEHDGTLMDQHGIRCTSVPMTDVVYEGGYSIPKRIMQTYRNRHIPVKMAAAVQSQIDMNPEFEYVYFDNNACDAFMRKHYKGSICDAYHCIKPGAFKCDIFRLAYLLIHGGWYLDISMVATRSLELFYEDVYNGVELILCRDTPSSKFGIYQAMIGTTPNNPLIRSVLLSITQRVLDNDMSDGYLSITGPTAFGRDANTFLGREEETEWTLGMDRKHQIYICDLVNDGCYTNNTKFMNRKYSGWERERVPGAHYGLMYQKGSKGIFNPCVNTKENQTSTYNNKTIHFVSKNRYMTMERIELGEAYKQMNDESGWTLVYTHPDDVHDFLFMYGGVAVLESCTEAIDVQKWVQELSETNSKYVTKYYNASVDGSNGVVCFDPETEKFRYGVV